MSIKGVKSNNVKSIKSDKIVNKRIDAAIEKVKIDTKDPCLILNEGKIMYSTKKLSSRICYVQKRRKNKINQLTFKKVH